MKLELEKLIKFCSFVCLCVIAIFFMKQVIEQFNSNDTSLKMSEVEITDFPTFTIDCNLVGHMAEFGIKIVAWEGLA